MTEFKLPIQYNDKCMLLNKHIIEDLELNKLNTTNAPITQNPVEEATVKTCCWAKAWCKPPPLKLSVDPKHIDEESIYGILFSPPHRFGKKTLVDMTKYYSYDKKYIKATQKIVKKYSSQGLNVGNVDFDMVLEKWNDIKGTKDFKDKYNFMTWKMLDFVNGSDTYLQFLSLYTLSTPVLALLFPIFILIIPFFIIKLKGLSLTVSEYYSIMKGLLKNHSIGKVLFHSSGELDIAKKAYLLLSVCFYFFSVYQNFATFIRFIGNFTKIHDYLFTMREYIDHVLGKMNHFKSIIHNVSCYNGFCNDLNTNISILTNYLDCLQKISPNKLSYNKVKQIGYVMKQFYDLNYNETYNKAIQYSFQCIGFLDNMEEFSKNSVKYKFGRCKFGNTTHFKNMSYPPLLDRGVKNDVSLQKQMILTGPNASGKTTILKSVLINILISQQMGYGCYSNGVLSMYHHIHSYLNIPDTSGRDSLFQAEARRCKEIVECIKENSKSTHFCIFDELYSGTNPDEAILSASAFMTYISEHNKVDSILTTHYIELCNNLQKNSAITNFQMDSIIGDNSIKYTYRMKPGISNIKGGIQILNDMNYPKEILDKFI